MPNSAKQCWAPVALYVAPFADGCKVRTLYAQNSLVAVLPMYDSWPPTPSPPMYVHFENWHVIQWPLPLDPLMPNSAKQCLAPKAWYVAPFADGCSRCTLSAHCSLVAVSPMYDSWPPTPSPIPYEQ